MTVGEQCPRCGTALVVHGSFPTRGVRFGFKPQVTGLKVGFRQGDGLAFVGPCRWTQQGEQEGTAGDQREKAAYCHSLVRSPSHG
jgi:hypothetical protein